MKRILLACLMIILVSSSFVLAGNRPGAFSVRLADGYYFFAPKRHLKNTSIPTIELGYDFNRQWGIKGGAGVLNTRTKRDLGGAHGIVYTLDGVYHLPACQHLEPYLLGGIGIISLKPSGSDPVNQANVNAGIGANYFFDPSIALGLEAKDLYTMSGGKNDVMLTAGITFLFGGETPDVVTVTHVPAPAHPSYKGEDLE
ncbi:MAG: hypothetical protein ACD_45C00215G0007 [uncultured bacterium]|nr:MAG: hypothetical protein ACD_45C00215G0007 [uncultured bacterium]